MWQALLCTDSWSQPTDWFAFAPLVDGSCFFFLFQSLAQSCLCSLGDVCIKGTSGQLAPCGGRSLGARGRSGWSVNRNCVGLYFSWENDIVFALLRSSSSCGGSFNHHQAQCRTGDQSSVVASWQQTADRGWNVAAVEPPTLSIPKWK